MRRVLVDILGSVLVVLASAFSGRGSKTQPPLQESMYGHFEPKTGRVTYLDRAQIRNL
jgi:hypothetical protein